MNLSDLFMPEPYSWGLRGDPFLWEEMRNKTSQMAVKINKRQFESLLHKLFYELTNTEFGSQESVFVERYNLGGMSSGLISTSFWKTFAFPLLLERFEELQRYHANIKKES